MANIANPLTGTKVDGSTFTAAEANAAGASFPRCLVNDGQSDLLANASIHGGTTKSFGFAGLTTFSTSTSGAQSHTAGSYILTSTGAVTVNAGDYTLDASGDVVLDAALDLSLISGQDIFFTPAGNWGGVAAQALFSGTGWPALGSRTITNHVPPFSVAYNLVAGAAEYDLSAFDMLWNQIATGGTIAFHLWFPPGTVVNSVSANLRSIGNPAAALPGTAPIVALWVINDATGVSTLLDDQLDAPASAAAFAAHHAVTATPASPHTVAAGTHLVLYVTGSVDADGQRWIKMSAPTANVTMTALRLA